MNGTPTNPTLDAEGIFRLIDNQSVSVKAGVKLIENYGKRKAGEAIEQTRKESGLVLDPEIEERIIRLNGVLDQFLSDSVDREIERQNGKRKGAEDEAVLP
jgi:hypothetical protein